MDEDGEFFWTVINAVKDFLVNTFVNVWTQGFNAWSDPNNWHNTAMAAKIDWGLFKGNPLQILSRFTWELPQTIAGYMANGAYATVGGVKSVGYYDGVTVTETYASGWGGFTLGSFIMGQRGIEADPNNWLFQHEFGHYLQSRAMGWAYIPRVAIPSAFSKGDHAFHPVEQDANSRAFTYFNSQVPGFYQTEEQYQANQRAGIEKGWNFYQNPLDVYRIGSASRGQYLDYHNWEQRDLIYQLRISAKWYDYFGWLGGVSGALGVGFGNTIYYNNKRKK